jgi:septum formation inhibitor MinC
MNSKISHLPKKLRDELGRRIEDGQPGTEIIQWLNDQPEVQAVLQERFDGRPINEQNLSDWKHHGHVEWLWRQETHDAAVRLLEESDELDDLMHSHSLTERFAALMTGELTRLAIKLLEYEANPDIRWRKVCEINRQLSILRRDEHRLMLIRLKQRQWLARCQASQNRAATAADRRPQAPVQAEAQTQTQIHETGESSPIKVNQGNTNSNFPHNGVSSEPRQPIAPATTPSASPTNGAPPASEINGKSIKANQDESSQKLKLPANQTPTVANAPVNGHTPNHTTPTPPIIPRLPKTAYPELPCNTILRIS